MGSRRYPLYEGSNKIGRSEDSHVFIDHPVSYSYYLQMQNDFKLNN